MKGSGQANLQATPLRLLLIDDDPNDRTLVIRALKKDFPGVRVNEVINAAQLEKALQEHNFDLVITDYNLYWTNGIKNLLQVKKRYPDCPVIMFTGTGTEEVAVEAMKAGLDDYILKSPKHFTRLPAAVGALLEHLRQRRRAREAEDQVRLLQKMESLGALAGGIAHDFGNIMTVIGSYTDLALRKIPPGAAGHAELEGIRQAFKQALALTRQLSDFSRKREERLEEVDCNILISGLEDMLDRLIGKKTVIKTRLTTESTTVMALKGELEQVIMNLVINARDAMPEGGMITIRTGATRIDGRESGRLAALRPGRYIVIEFSDTGRGMDQETVEHIFEPLFTTKKAGTGSGLGLSIVYGIINRIGGYIEAESEPGEGTIFRIFLPGEFQE